MNTTMDRINNICSYNINLINLIERKLTLYKNARLVYNRHKVKGYKEDMTRMHNGLEAIKDTLATMNIELMIDYNSYSAVFNDLTNSSTIEIKAR